MKDIIQFRKDIINLCYPNHPNIEFSGNRIRIILLPKHIKLLKEKYGGNWRVYWSLHLQTLRIYEGSCCHINSSAYFYKSSFKMILSENLKTVLKKKSIELDEETAKILSLINFQLIGLTKIKLTLEGYNKLTIDNIEI